MKVCKPAKAARFNGRIINLTGHLRVKNGQLVDRETGERLALHGELEGLNVIVIDEEHMNRILQERFMSGCA